MTHPNFVSKMDDNVADVSCMMFCITFVLQTYYVLLDMLMRLSYTQVAFKLAATINHRSRTYDNSQGSVGYFVGSLLSEHFRAFSETDITNRI